MASPGQEKTFVVRMWALPGKEPPRTQWRGSITDVETGKRRFFVDPREISDFIAAQVAGSEAPPTEQTLLPERIDK